MSARTQWLIAMDSQDELTELGRKTAKADEYFQKEDKWKTGGGMAGAYAGGKTGAAIGTYFAPGLGTMIGAGIGTALGYVGGAKIGEEFAEKSIDGEWNIGQEDVYSNRASEFHTDMNTGKFYKADRGDTSKSLIGQAEASDRGDWYKGAAAGISAGFATKAPVDTGYYGGGTGSGNYASKELADKYAGKTGMNLLRGSLSDRFGAGKTMADAAEVTDAIEVADVAEVAEAPKLSNFESERQKWQKRITQENKSWMSEGTDPMAHEYYPNKVYGATGETGSGETKSLFDSIGLPSAEKSDKLKAIETERASQISQNPHVLAQKEADASLLKQNTQRAHEQKAMQSEMRKQSTILKKRDVEGAKYGHDPFGLTTDKKKVKGLSAKSITDGKINYEDTMGRDILEAQKFSDKEMTAKYNASQIKKMKPVSDDKPMELYKPKSSNAPFKSKYELKKMDLKHQEDLLSATHLNKDTPEGLKRLHNAKVKSKWLADKDAVLGTEGGFSRKPFATAKSLPTKGGGKSHGKKAKAVFDESWGKDPSPTFKPPKLDYNKGIMKDKVINNELIDKLKPGSPEWIKNQVQTFVGKKQKPKYAPDHKWFKYNDLLLAEWNKGKK